MLTAVQSDLAHSTTRMAYILTWPASDGPMYGSKQVAFHTADLQSSYSRLCVSLACLQVSLHADKDCTWSHIRSSFAEGAPLPPMQSMSNARFSFLGR